MQQAATELATLVKTQIIAKGATRVAVLNLGDASVTPDFRGLPAADKALLTQLSAEFNTALSAGLSGAAVQMIDARAIYAAFLANPVGFGITNTTDAACDPAAISAITAGRVTSGSSLFCNAAAAALFTAAPPAGAGLPRSLNGLKTGASASTWYFADGVHPTTAGHRIFADQVFAKLKEFDWIPANQ
ncbi:MAG: SGNH/GDSL hydrolase family protein [Burkholderiaceae bacterium]|nr:SGNH/GDSL hydrolase family protein [Burkholderiaceae bacterium]